MWRLSGAHRGFTLLEMLFVLVVVGLLVGLTVPRFAAGLEQRELIAQRADIEDQLRELPRRVRLNAHPLQLPVDLKQPDMGDGYVPLRLPVGWQIVFTPPLEISMLGTCSASRVEVSKADNPGMDSAYQIAPLSCELSSIPR
jgi:prepilin-type N-terminal cleavage/methylation domain-containing protein